MAAALRRLRGTEVERVRPEPEPPPPLWGMAPFRCAQHRSSGQRAVQGGSQVTAQFLLLFCLSQLLTLCYVIDPLRPPSAPPLLFPSPEVLPRALVCCVSSEKEVKRSQFCFVSSLFLPSSFVLMIA